MKPILPGPRVCITSSRSASSQMIAGDLPPSSSAVRVSLSAVRFTTSTPMAVPPVSATTEATAPVVPDQGAVYCSKDDLAGCAALALGSPTRFGNIAAPLKHFLDSTADLWMQHVLVDKPATVFCATASYHGGQESTLLSMMLPLLYHGMIIAGVPYSVADLNATVTGGTPYGASHVAGAEHTPELSEHEAEIARMQGVRLATLAGKLS